MITHAGPTRDLILVGSLEIFGFREREREREDRVPCEAFVPDREKQFRNDEQKNLPFPGSEQTPRGGKLGGS